MSYPFRAKLSASYLYPVFILERLINHKLRHKLRRLTVGLIGLIILIFMVAVILVLGLGEGGNQSVVSSLGEWVTILVGVLCLVLLGFITLFQLELFYRHYVYNQRKLFLPRLVDINVGRLLYTTSETDVLLAFLEVSWGRRVTLRAGLTVSALAKFIESRRERTVVSTVDLKPDQLLTLSLLAQRLRELNPDFNQLIKTEGRLEEDWDQAARWVESEEKITEEAERWWSRGALGRLPGLAKDWSYGQLPNLSRYARELTVEARLTARSQTANILTGELKQIEEILVRRREANIFLLSESSEQAFDVVWRLAEVIVSGQVLPQLEAKKVFLFDSSLFLAQVKDRQQLEARFLSLLAESSRAGNVILAIDNLPRLLTEAQSLGVDLPALLNSYLTRPAISFLGLATRLEGEKLITTSPDLISKFETINLPAPALADLTQFIRPLASKIEEDHQVIFTIGSLRLVGQVIQNLAAGREVYDRVIDLLSTLAEGTKIKGETVVNPELASTLLSDSTHIPIGPISQAEKTTLLTLETKLRERVIGQDQALKLVAQALRRSRLQLKSDRRPLGSFLFLGPTGVGKTETAKALAELLFGSADHLARFDMSEFNSPDAVVQLIGGTGEVVGRLTATLREQPYTVLLLDELEKADKSVHDLLLQILDEGIFTTGAGEAVSARNALIIATSNAAADHIWSLAESGKLSSLTPNNLMAEVIKRRLFRPELLNRFDAVVPYRVLSAQETSRVTRLLLVRLAERLRRKGITLMIDDVLVNFLVGRERNPAFGARAIERLIQDEVEETIAQALLGNQIKSGDSIRLADADNQLQVIIV